MWGIYVLVVFVHVMGGEIMIQYWHIIHPTDRIIR